MLQPNLCVLCVYQCICVHTRMFYEKGRGCWNTDDLKRGPGYNAGMGSEVGPRGSYKTIYIYFNFKSFAQ